MWSRRSSLAGELTGQRYRACEVDAHNRASTQGMSISKGIVLQDQQLDVNFVICQRHEVLQEVSGKVGDKEVYICGHRVSEPGKSMRVEIEQN